MKESLKQFVTYFCLLSLGFMLGITAGVIITYSLPCSKCNLPLVQDASRVYGPKIPSQKVKELELALQRLQQQINFHSVELKFLRSSNEQHNNRIQHLEESLKPGTQVTTFAAPIPTYESYWYENCYGVAVAMFNFQFSMHGPGIESPLLCSEESLSIMHLPSYCTIPLACDSINNHAYICKMPTSPCDLPNERICHDLEVQSNIPCEVLFDLDEDEDIDLRDFSLLQNEHYQKFMN